MEFEEKHRRDDDSVVTVSSYTSDADSGAGSDSCSELSSDDTPKAPSKQLTLLPHQEKHARKIELTFQLSRWYIDGSSMGSGKTYVTSYLAKKHGLSLFVVAPKSALSVWHGIAKEYDIPVVAIMTYEGLRGRAGCGAGPKDPKAWLRTNRFTRSRCQELKYVAASRLRTLLSSKKHGLLFIFDESQRVKNKSITAKAVRAIARALVHDAPAKNKSRIAFLSASPFDKPEHVINFCHVSAVMRTAYLRRRILCSSSGVVTAVDGATAKNKKPNSRIVYPGVEDMLAFSHSMIQTYRKTFPGKAEGALRRMRRHINTVRIRLSAGKGPKLDECGTIVYSLFTKVVKPLLLHVSPPPMPEKSATSKRDVRNLICPMPPALVDDYKIAVGNLDDAVKLAAMQSKGKKKGAAGEPPSFAAIQMAMMELQNVKEPLFSNVAKYTLDMVPNSKVVLFADFYSVIRKLEDKLSEYGVVVLCGEQDPEERASVVRRFQEHNTRVRVIISNPVVGGMAVSLHDTTGDYPRFMFLNPGFRANELFQCTGRTYRAGTKGVSTVRFVYGGVQESETSKIETAEVRILSSLQKKGVVLEHTIGEQKVPFPHDYPSESETKFIQRINSF
jgi:hypothetical protein